MQPTKKKIWYVSEDSKENINKEFQNKKIGKHYVKKKFLEGICFPRMFLNVSEFFLIKSNAEGKLQSKFGLSNFHLQ